MYELHYGFVKPKYNGKLSLTDTDSLVCEGFYRDKNLFDVSNYPRN